MKKNNESGFTLVELIAVVVIIGILTLIAIPNIVNLVDKGKKEQYVVDGKEMISKAKYCYRLEKCSSKFVTSASCKVIAVSNLDYSRYETADGGEYDLANSSVKVCTESGEDVFYVLTKSKKNGENGRGIPAYKAEKELNVDDVK